MLLVCVLLALMLTGCGLRYPEMPDDAVAFHSGEYIDREDDGAGYLAIEYRGRTYLPYGTIDGTLQNGDLGRCLGYIVQDEQNSSDPDPKTVRVYTLTEDPDCNYLMEHYIGTTLMNPPSFLRAIDTRGKEIDTPPFIQSLSYSFWKMN